MIFTQIYDWCKEGLDAGKHVVRLKIGDPFVFGRGGEEVLVFREYGVEPKVIPVSKIDAFPHEEQINQDNIQLMNNLLVLCSLFVQ